MIESAEAFERRLFSMTRSAARQAAIETRDRQQFEAGRRAAFEWRPIESAPKDGSEFVAAYGHQGFVKQLVRWGKLYKRWESKGKPELGFLENATHWMPLPDPPIAAKPRSRRHD